MRHLVNQGRSDFLPAPGADVDGDDSTADQSYRRQTDEPVVPVLKRAVVAFAIEENDSLTRSVDRHYTVPSSVGALYISRDAAQDFNQRLVLDVGEELILPKLRRTSVRGQ